MRWFYKDVAPTGAFVPDEMLYVLQHEGARLVVVENVGDGEEEVALFLVREAVLAAEAVLLGDAREVEGLAENVMGGDVVNIHLVDVACRFFAEVGGVGLAAELVPVAGEHALRARPLEGEPEPANATEEVDEP